MSDDGPRIELRLQAGTGPSGEVALVNDAAREIRVWKPGNQWGDAPLSFELDDGERTTPILRAPRRYTRNVPAWRSLAAGEQYELPFDLRDGSWQTHEALADPIAPNARLIAIYDVPETPEALEHGVWIGALRSAPVAVGDPPES